MASQDKEMGPSTGSSWASILQAVREQLPSLDSDSSLSDCGEEELFIFQRNHSALIPDLSEELAEDLEGAWLTDAHRSPPEAELVPVNFGVEPWSARSMRTGSLACPEQKEPGSPLRNCSKIRSSPGGPEDTPRWQEGDLEIITSKPREVQIPKGPSGEATSVAPFESLDIKPQSAMPLEGKDSAAAHRQALRRERRRMIEKDILHRVPWEAAGPLTPLQEPKESPLLLNLQQLEESDLDGLLHRLTKREGQQGEDTPRAMGPADEHLQHQVRTERRVQDRLMEQLALLCASEPQAHASVHKVPAAGSLDTRPLEAPGRELDPPGNQGVRLRTIMEPPTVFLDLRIPGPTNLETEESSSSSDEDGDDYNLETAAPGVQHGPRGLWDCTGKSQLLQQLRAFRQSLAQPALPTLQGPGGQRARTSGDTRGQRVQTSADTLLPGTPRENTQAKPLGGSASVLEDSPGPGEMGEALLAPL